MNSRIFKLTPEVLISGSLDRSIITIELQNDTISQVGSSELILSKFTGDFKNIFIRVTGALFYMNAIDFEVDGMVVNETGRATLTIPEAVFTSGKEMVVHFETIAE